MRFRVGVVLRVLVKEGPVEYVSLKRDPHQKKKSTFLAISGQSKQLPHVRA